MKKSKSQKAKSEKGPAGENEIADDMPGKPDLPEEFLIVGIGASAGGIQALKEFFENVPADSGMAYVVIQHLSPNHDSRLAEVLQTVAQIPVRQVTQKVRVEPNCVYVVPPNEHLEMFDGHIVVTTNINVEERRAPVDIFFRTLAEANHARAVAVILSGTGANGSMGIKRIKERGGAAFVQNPREAEFSEMPRNSIATNLIDQILNVAEIPKNIIAYKESLGKVEISVEPEQRPEKQQYALREIFTTLRLRTELYQAVQNQTNVEIRNLKINQGDERINIHARPVLQHSEDTARGFILVLFETVRDGDLRTDTIVQSEELNTSQEPLARQFEEELVRTKSQLRTTIEQFEIQAEELKASNEELQAMNEKLRSAAEELETSKEELQSLNEELITVNQELKVRLEELSLSNNDFQNLINSTDIATIFLDRSFRIHTFTPAASRIFNLIPADFGRPLTDITHRLETDSLLQDAEKVLDNLQTVEREVRTIDGRTYLLRVLPYRTQEDRINGVVATFLEITERKQGENALRESESRLKSITNLVPDLLWDSEPDGSTSSYNHRWLEYTGQSFEEATSRGWIDAVHPDERKASARLYREASEKGEPLRFENRIRRFDGEYRWFVVNTFPLKDESGQVIKIYGAATDIHDSRLILEALRGSEEQFRRAIEDAPIPVIMHAEDGEVLQISRTWTELTGYTLEDKQVIQTWLTKAYGFGGDELRNAMKIAFVPQAGKPLRAVEFDIITKQGEHRTWSFSASTPGTLRDGRRFIVGMAEDVTERRKTAEALRKSEGRLRALVENLPGGAVFVVDKDLRYLIAEGEALAAAGFKPKDLIGRTVAEAMPPKLVESCEPMYRKALTGKPFEHEHEAHNRNFMTRGVPLTNADGSVDGVLAISYDITERKRAEQIVSESEERLRLATEASEMATWEWNLLTDEIFLNKRHFDLFGMKPRKNPLKPDVFFKHVHPDDRERIGDLLKTAIAEKSIFDTDFRAVLDNDGIRWMSGYGRVVEASREGEPVRMSGVMFDITERKAAEQALRESEIRYRAIVGQSTAGITELDLNGYHVFANPGYCETLGYTEAELLKMNLRDITHPDDYARCHELFNDTITTGTPHVSEKRVVCKNGRIVWINESLSRIADAEGNPLRVTMIAIDITNRRRAEMALGESETRLRLLIESASDYAIFTMTIDGIVDSWNSGAEKVFGWKEKEILGKSGDIIFTPEDRKKRVPEKERKSALRAGRAPDERFHLRKNGSRFYVSGVVTVMKNDRGDVLGFVKIARDMTEQIKTEKTLREKEILQTMVSTQEDERRRIARDLHDELGQQLTALRLKLDVARRLCEKDEELCGKIDEIELIAQSIDNGVDFLAWELRPAALDQLGLVPALENYIEQWSYHSGVSAELLASKLKRARFAPEVETNLYRIVQEALNNTNKHAKAKRVEVVLEKRNDLIVLIVEDDGIGFNPQDKKKRLKGMGLLGMRERAQLAGGELEIESAPGKGTTIYIRVPAAPNKRRNSNDG